MASAPSPATKTERLLNLVICLLYTRQPLSKQAIRAAVPQYGDAASDEAFDRMFERDKDELRELGIPLRTEPLDAYFEDEPGYRIDRREYALPDIPFAADELAVLALASRTWQQAALGGAAAQAMRKLQAEDVERDVDGVVGLEPRIRTTEPAFEAVKNAVMARRVITFGYRRGGAASQRRMQPWAVANWHGNWYVTGLDLDREAPRVFRLSRITGAVKAQGKPDAFTAPADHDALGMVASAEPGSAASSATVRVRAGAGNSLRRRATGAVSSDGGWDTFEVPFQDTSRFAGELVGYGPAVVVTHPPELVAAVTARLRDVLEAR
ncbi:helix-turn-helix transcriptional regulator [Dermacoccaceae bacterium W4C1]